MPDGIVTGNMKPLGVLCLYLFLSGGVLLKNNGGENDIFCNIQEKSYLTLKLTNIGRSLFHKLGEVPSAPLPV